MIRKSKRALSDEQVHQARYEYYNENLTQKELAERYNTSPRVIQCVIQSLGSYANVPDRVPQEIKDLRVHPNTDPLNGNYIGRRAKIKERKRQAEIAEQERIQKYRETIARRYPEAAAEMGFIKEEK